MSHSHRPEDLAEAQRIADARECPITYSSSPGAPLIEATPRCQGSLLDRVRVCREGSAVERCHQLPHALRYSVGHHTLDLITLLILSWQKANAGQLPRAELITAAAFHDTPGERIIGDIPSHIKRLMGGDAIDAIENEGVSRCGVAVELTADELEYLDGADKVELWLWCHEEIELRGNKAAQSFLIGLNTYLEGHPPPWPMMDLMEEVSASGIGRLNGNILTEWGGYPNV